MNSVDRDDAPREGGFLRAPTDPLLLLSSPPCSPIPADWQLQVEEAPHAEPETFDLDGGGGLVALGDGRVIDLDGGSGEDGKCYVRRGAVVAHLRTADRPTRPSGTAQGGPLPGPTPPPVIIVDCYE